jgi:transcriptional regulator with XRE-family HTH domain
VKQEKINKILGERVRSLRISRGLSQEELGERSALDRTYVSGIERGVRNPTLTVLAALAAGLKVSIADLFKMDKEG